MQLTKEQTAEILNALGYQIDRTYKFKIRDEHTPSASINPKDGKIKEFEDACAAVLSESRIELKKSEALNYLADVNMITRRSYKDLDTAMRKATQIRNRKE